MVRDEKGRFAKGNGGGPGRPPRKREERYRQILRQTVTYKQFRAIIEKVADKAEKGDLNAAKLIFEYLIGKPVQGLELTGAEGGAIVLRWPEDGDNAS